jgi:hypothetical protein
MWLRTGQSIQYEHGAFGFYRRADEQTLHSQGGLSTMQVSIGKTKRSCPYRYCILCKYNVVKFKGITFKTTLM